MVYFISYKELTRVSRKTIIAELRQVAGELIRDHPKIQSMDFPLTHMDPPCGESKRNTTLTIA